MRTTREKASGRWEHLGIVGMGCNLPTTDGGEVCSTGVTSEGFCLPIQTQAVKEDDSESQTPNKEHLEQINQAVRESEGSCSEWKLKFGRFVVVESGRLRETCIEQSMKQPPSISPCRTLKAEHLWGLRVSR